MQEIQQIVYDTHVIDDDDDDNDSADNLSRFFIFVQIEQHRLKRFLSLGFSPSVCIRSDFFLSKITFMSCSARDSISNFNIRFRNRSICIAIKTFCKFRNTKGERCENLIRKTEKSIDNNLFVIALNHVCVC